MPPVPRGLNHHIAAVQNAISRSGCDHTYSTHDESSGLRDRAHRLRRAKNRVPILHDAVCQAQLRVVTTVRLLTAPHELVATPDTGHVRAAAVLLNHISALRTMSNVLPHSPEVKLRRFRGAEPEAAVCTTPGPLARAAAPCIAVGAHEASWTPFNLRELIALRAFVLISCPAVS
eukprot:scaffold5443_cov291-Pinguiococcus_pyrenoidosus.AAC.14